MKNVYNDEFIIDEEREVINCHSISGNKYQLVFDSDEQLICNCKGFAFRGYCRHVKKAKDLIYAKKLLDTIKTKKKSNHLFVVCYAEHENRLIVNSEQLITVLDNAKKHNSKVKVFKLGEKVIDWA